MCKGNDPQTAAPLGGVHKRLEPRPALSMEAGCAEQPIVVEGRRAGVSRAVDDPDQASRVVHTKPPPVKAPLQINAPKSALNLPRTTKHPFTVAQRAPDQALVWTAAKDPHRRGPGRSVAQSQGAWVHGRTPEPPRP
ncbi:hypothetical protein [Caulobacter vibrioides]|uniref:hypothetical protein n=1 Tax=Caulobacter vibrioides TaxID=155892 RepID=UPI0015E64470|nr:hypothetical protein [Caulobacter vibrioides]